MAKLEFRTGRGLRDVAAEAAKAWKAAEAGTASPAVDNMTFVDWDALNAVLTPRRIEMMRYLRHTTAPSIRALARGLERDVKHVHADVVALQELGLVERIEAGLTSQVDEITSTIRIAA